MAHASETKPVSVREDGHAPSEDEILDESLKDSMDASDPPSSTHPDDKGDPVPSSGFKE